MFDDQTLYAISQSLKVQVTGLSADIEIPEDLLHTSTAAEAGQNLLAHLGSLLFDEGDEEAGVACDQGSLKTITDDFLKNLFEFTCILDD